MTLLTNLLLVDVGFFCRLLKPNFSDFQRGFVQQCARFPNSVECLKNFVCIDIPWLFQRQSAKQNSIRSTMAVPRFFVFQAPSSARTTSVAYFLLFSMFSRQKWHQTTNAKTAISGHLTAIVSTFVFLLYQHSNFNYKYRYARLKIGNSC